MATKKSSTSRRSTKSKSGSEVDWINIVNQLVEHGPKLFNFAYGIWNRFQGNEEEKAIKGQRDRLPEAVINEDVESFEWWRILGVKMYATAEQIEKAFKLKMAKVHPDKVAHLSEKLQEVAELEAKLLIEARRQGLDRFGL